MSILAEDHYVPREQTSDPDLVPVVVTKLDGDVEVWRCPITGHLMVSGLDGVAELTPAAEAALATLIMLDGAK